MSAAPSTSQANALFWNELCGTQMARDLGIHDRSPESLRRFDAAYLDFYPYLRRYVRPEARAGHRVVEIGLGYGTVGQKIAEAGANYLGLDVARGPVEMMSYRLQTSGLRGRAARADVLSCPVATGSVDCVVSIGCLHHTGDLARAIREVHRILRPGGQAILMVYNLLSYKSWGRWPLRTLAEWRREREGDAPRTAGVRQRAAYDANLSGAAAPETVLVSEHRLRRMCAAFASVEVYRENTSDLTLGGTLPLPFGLRFTLGLLVPRRLTYRWAGPVAGLDLYLTAVK
jgi:SAM-dependent methyltransferase